MTRFGWLSVIAAVLLTACSTAQKVPETAGPAAGAATSGAATAAEPAQDWRQVVEDALAGAEDAADHGTDDEFDACEAVIVGTLQDPARAPRSADDEAFIGTALEDLQHLRDELGQSDESEEDQVAEETPPEPQPVPETDVTEARKKAEGERYDLPVVVNAEVTSLIRYYTGPYREKLITAMQRGGRYLRYIRAEFKKAGLPQDLAYLPLVESAFNTRAHSRARAQGMWQFMKGTASLYGLRCDGLVDERNDPYLATDAAVSHLADLYSTFNDWELALAAYNSGAGRVLRAQRRNRGNDDFWTIRRYLPRETRNYVPAFWAALIVAKDPQEFGLPPWDEASPCIKRVAVEGALDLDVLADHTSLDRNELGELNPALVYGVTAPRGTYQLAVPCGEEDVVAEAIAAIPENERVRHFVHVIRSGDTLGALARHYGSTVPAIMSANGIRNPRRLRIGQQLIIPRAFGRQGSYTVASSSRPQRYTVRRGDTLYGIARRFGTSVNQIQRKNGLSDSVIRPGDVLLVP